MYPDINLLRKKNILFNYVLAAFLAVAGVVLTGCATVQDAPADAASEVYYKGLRFFNKGRYAEAKEFFHEYISENAGTHLYPVSLYYLGYCYQKLTDQAQARLIYHKVIDENEDDFWAQMAKTRLGEMGDELKEK